MSSNPIHCFIDTNIFLRFLGYSKDDLEKLKILAASVKKGSVVLYVTEQVRNEYFKRREQEIDTVLRDAKKKKIDEGFPVTFQAYKEYEDLRKAINTFNKARDTLVNSVLEDAINYKLSADELVSDIFGSANYIEINENSVQKAHLRVKLNNPPGKRGYGDAVNWELLLAAVPSELQGEFYLVTNDSDFASPLQPHQISRFLSAEWNVSKSSVLVLYTSLSQFFATHFPEIQLAAEMERKDLIDDLVNSPSFQRTHSAILALSEYDNFTDNEVKSLVVAAVANTQISWICADGDVNSFFTRIYHGREHLFDEATQKDFHSLYEELGSVQELTYLEDEDDDPPF